MAATTLGMAAGVHQSGDSVGCMAGWDVVNVRFKLEGVFVRVPVYGDVDKVSFVW